MFVLAFQGFLLLSGCTKNFTLRPLDGRSITDRTEQNWQKNLNFSDHPVPSQAAGCQGRKGWCRGASRCKRQISFQQPLIKQFYDHNQKFFVSTAKLVWNYNPEMTRNSRKGKTLGNVTRFPVNVNWVPGFPELWPSFPKIWLSFPKGDIIFFKFKE